MKVFEVLPDEGRFQMIGDAGFAKKYPRTNAKNRLFANWETLSLPVDDPSKARGDFLFFPLEYLVCAAEVNDAYAECVCGDVQVLPVRIQDDPAPYVFWNIVNYVDALDTEKTTYRAPPFRSLPRDWVFKPSALSRPMLFHDIRLPMILLVVTFGQASNDFYGQYQKRRAKGLRFKLLWEQ